MFHRLIAYVAETHVHPGERDEYGVVDRPVAREAVNGLQFVPGHSHKGAIKAGVSLRIETEVITEHDGVSAMASAFYGVFGGDTDNPGAGALIVGDARLVLLPVRASGYPFVFATSRYVLSRLARDLDRSGQSTVAKRLRTFLSTIIDGGTGEALLSNSITTVHGYRFEQIGGIGRRVEMEGIRKELADFLCVQLGLPMELGVQNGLALFHDTAFDHLAQIALPVRARNVLDANKQSQNLWYEETLPPDTVMTTLLGHRGKVGVDEGDGEIEWVSPVDLVLEALEYGDEGLRYLQIGGNETVGQGWFQVCVSNEAAPQSDTVA